MAKKDVNIMRKKFCISHLTHEWRIERIERNNHQKLIFVLKSFTGLTTLSTNMVTHILLSNPICNFYANKICWNWKISLSVDIRVKWGKIWDSSKKLACILTFLSPLPHVPYLSQNKRTAQRFLKKMQSMKLEENIKYQTLCRSKFRNKGAPFTWILKKQSNYWWKNIKFQRLVGQLKF